MYEIEEFFSLNGNDLKDLLKSCVYNYYIKNKDKMLDFHNLQKEKSSYVISKNNKYKIFSKGVKNV